MTIDLKNFETSDLLILNNLSNKLEIQTIFSKKNIKINLDDLPINLNTLILYGNEFNLDNLPENLKILEIMTYFNHKFPLEHLHNLPNGLEEIKINNNIYNSVEDLLNNYVV